MFNLFIYFWGLKPILLKDKEDCKVLQSQGFCGNLTVVDGYLRCPTCRSNKRLLKIDPDTTATGLTVFCRFCKTEHKIDISKGQCFESRSQRRSP